MLVDGDASCSPTCPEHAPITVTRPLSTSLVCIKHISQSAVSVRRIQCQSVSEFGCSGPSCRISTMDRRDGGLFATQGLPADGFVLVLAVIAAADSVSHMISPLRPFKDCTSILQCVGIPVDSRFCHVPKINCHSSSAGVVCRRLLPFQPEILHSQLCLLSCWVSIQWLAGRFPPGLHVSQCAAVLSSHSGLVKSLCLTLRQTGRLDPLALSLNLQTFHGN